MLEVIILLLFPLAMFYAAASDMFSMTISNKVSLVLVAGFVVLSWAIGMDLQAIAWHWALAALVLVAVSGFCRWPDGWRRCKISCGHIPLARLGAYFALSCNG